LEGVALMKAFAGGFDRAFTEARLAEVRSLLDAGDALGTGVDVPPPRHRRRVRRLGTALRQPGQRHLRHGGGRPRTPRSGTTPPSWSGTWSWRTAA